MAVNAPAPAEVVQAQPTMAEAALRGAKTLDVAKAPKRLAASAERAKGLREFDARHKDAAAIMAEARAQRSRPLNDTELKQLDKIDPALASEARQFGTYTEVMAEAIKSGKKPEVVALAKRVPDFDKTRDEVVGRMAKLDIFQKMEGFSDLTPIQQKAFVEQTFATNDRVRAIYLQNMRDVSREAMQLPEDQKSKAGGETAQQIAEQTAKRTAAIDRMRVRLGPQAAKLTDGEVEAMFAGGRSPEEARLAVMDKALELNGVDPTHYHARQEAQAADVRLGELQSEFQADHMKGPNAGSTFDIDGYVKGNATDQRVLEYKILQMRKGEIAQLKINITPDQELIIERTRRVVYGTMDRDAGVRVGGIDAELRTIHQNMPGREVAVATGPTLSVEQAQLQRERESKLVVLQEKMQEALVNAVETAWSEQIDETRDIMERKQLAETAEKAEEEKTTKDRALIRLTEQQNHNWIGMDKTKGNRTVNYEQIGTDVRYVAREGEEGVKRLMLRDMMMGGEGAIVRMNGPDGKTPLTMNPDGILVGADGSPHMITIQQRQPDGQYTSQSVPATWKNVPYESLPEESRGLLNTLQAEQGNNYATRLIMDLEQARHPHSLKEGIKIFGNLPTLNLSRDEISALHTKLGETLVNGIQKGKDAEKIMDKLATMGITERGGKSIASLMLMLMMLLGFGGVKRED